MNLKIHNKFLKVTFELANAAREKGNHPFGAVLVHRGQIVHQSENSIRSDSDITKHAEFKLIQFAVQNFCLKFLQEATLYSSTEPCSMCSGAIYWSKIGTVVYGTSLKTLSNQVGGTLEVPCRNILNRGKHEITVIGPLMETEGLAVHDGFWSPQIK